MLSGLSAPGLSASLADRLLVVPDAEPSSDAGTAFPPGLPPVVVPASFGPRPRRTRDDSTTARSHRRAVVFGATGGLTAFMVGMTVVAAAGAQDDNEPVAPSLEAYTVEHGRSAGSLPMSDPANSIGARVAHRPGR